MNHRPALYELADRHQLSPAQTRALFTLADLDAPPRQLQVRFWQVTALLAAGLGGFGLIMWVAANWDSLGRMGKFGLLQGWVALTALAAWRVAALRTPMGLLCLLGIGALFAYFGQTYQTGADAWQLFALWALLALPLCLGVRSDVVWLPWVVVACSGISLWTYTHTDHRWRADGSDLPIHLVGWALGALIVTLLSPWAQRWTGGASSARRLALLAMVVSITLAAVAGLFSEHGMAHYLLGLAVLGTAAVVLLQPRWFDIFGLSAVVLSLDALLVGGWVRLMFNDSSAGDLIGRLLLTGLVAAGLLAASVALIMRRHKQVQAGTPAGASA
ncbi:MAG: DUF2157 domain-containing protein [Variovorax sp.]|nr:MAG: DUF2157 domain-containing protein [Variovorax sp.]